MPRGKGQFACSHHSRSSSPEGRQGPVPQTTRCRAQSRAPCLWTECPRQRRWAASRAGLAQSGSALWAGCGQVPNWGLAGQWGPWREGGQSSLGRGSCRLPPAASGDQLAHVAQVNVSFSLSLELLSYQKLPADQTLPGVDIQQRTSGEKEMVFTQNLLLEHTNQTTQVSPGRPISVPHVAVPELQLSTSWVDFGICFVNQGWVREVYLMKMSGCRSYWAVLMRVVSYGSPGWWWKLCSVRRPAPCSSGTKAPPALRLLPAPQP
ncbi:uncharacterized protein LOC125103000 [Lutra lutra]|uniref:uncharacterized protein LOC125103000 n=1 Tax=Lutra lutra TaxID=9657 RepID=UPI001FD4BC67|nr:uncharacterized protein LOC125103000 [Lutra lutra]